MSLTDTAPSAAPPKTTANAKRRQVIREFKLGYNRTMPQTVLMPMGAIIVHAAFSGGIRLFARCDPDAKNAPRILQLFGNDEDLPDQINEWRYITTIPTESDPLHVFELRTYGTQPPV